MIEHYQDMQRCATHEKGPASACTLSLGIQSVFRRGVLPV